MSILRLSSSLPSELENLVTRVIGCCIVVHRELGPGLLESIYSRAIDIELRTAGIPVAREVWIQVSYRGELLCRQRLDIVVGGELLIEVKAVERLNPVHQAQILSYLRIAKLRIGLLMNFNVPVLHQGQKRFVL